MQDQFTFKTNTIQANGLNFSWIEQGSGPLVLALHGFPDTPRTFRYQMQALAQAGYRTIAPYMRGYYPTDAPLNVSYERAALTQDVLALIDLHSGDQPVTLIGHDWGASAAYGAAVLAAEKIAKLITIAVPYGETWWNAIITNPDQQRRSWYMFLFQMPWAEEAVAHNDFVFLERLWQDWSPGWNYSREELQIVKETFQKPGVLTATINYYRHAFNPPDDQPNLQTIRERSGEPIAVPTLYIHGERDGGIGIENLEGMENWFTEGFEKRVIAEAGHFVQQERPEHVNRLILDFIQAK